MGKVLSLPDFRLLFTGTAASLLGDQFSLIATPWLVLKMTSDPLALGLILALEGLPRALFMLLGGAITDRFSPRKVMLAASLMRFALTALMALLVFSGAAEMWMIYLFGLLFGILAGFAVPAENSIVPMLVKKEDLQAGNSLIMGVTQLAGFIGPSLAGILIGRFSSSNTGIVLSFSIDSLTFLVSALTIWLIRQNMEKQAAIETGQTQQGMLAEILEGVRYLWADTALRMMFSVLMALNFLLIGPLMVGIPVLADQRLPQGAAAYGLLLSAFAGGSLLGILLAGTLPRPCWKSLSALILLLLASFGVAIALLGLSASTWLDFGLLALLGLGNGYMSILLFTWIQTRTPQNMLGRMMSLFTFSSTGLVPVSQALAGVVCKWSTTFMFLIAGLLVLVLTLWAALQPDFKTFSSSLSEAGADA